jgi:hypothetical protein
MSLKSLHNFSNRGIKLDMATLISYSTLIFALYLLFITATAETPASHKYDVENGIKIR